jgi:hypothetical protein
MTIEFNSWHEAIVFMLAVIAITTAVATLHWKIFAEPLLRKILSPYSERLDVVSRVVEGAHPEEYQRAARVVMSERDLRRAI